MSYYFSHESLTKGLDASVSPKEIFLHKFLHSGSIESGGINNGALTFKGALQQHETCMLRIVENVVRAIDIQHTKNGDLFVSIEKGMASVKWRQQLEIFMEDLKTSIGM